MKNILKTFGLFAIASLVFTSCDDEDNTGASMIDFTPVTVQFTTASSSYTFSESDINPDDEATNTIEVTATIPEPQPVNAVLDVVIKSGNGEASDFQAEPVTIPAGATSVTSKITILQTGDIEGNENLVLGFKSRGNFYSDFTIPVTIEDDYINEILDVTVDWSGSYTIDQGSAQTTIDYCGIDFDLILLDESMNLVDYTAATASCPEHGTISGLADGTYYLLVDLYENPFAGIGANQDLPLNITYSQEYFIGESSFTYNGFTTEDTSGQVLIAEINVVNGYQYTVTPL
ncbi:hypothetical protein [Tenacibaculum sp. IB213877]|uniref:hypothetical protein n=1 Tax=Tenacibaculum sp. IB213877 TaxID=3097351 RepID=UPI002A59C652|nr:hypothetical protein [Tenacibaculum sp. IB213877]MDY0780083.1 hypothetical protein [Tenacibaculum sp. IB213877]